MAERPMEHFTVDGVNIFEVTDAKARQDVSNLKDDFHEYHSDLGAGYADQIVSSIENEDSVPYNFRAVPYDATLEKVEGIVGVDVVLNQLINHGNFDASGSWFEYACTCTFADGVATVTPTDAISRIFQTRAVVLGHKYFMIATFKGTSGEGNAMLSWYAGVNVFVPFTGSWQTISVIVDNTFQTSDVWRLYYGSTSNANKVPYMVKDAMCFDLTAMFGTQIADYIYSLEQATAGSGVAWLKEHFPKIFNAGYIAYNAGTMVHVSGLSAHKTVGFNQWDEQWELGTIIPSNGQNASSSTKIRSKNYIPVIPSATYHIHVGSTSSDTDYVYFYDSNNAYVGNNYASHGATWDWNFTIPNNARYMRFIMKGTTYNHDICINLSDPTKNGTYEPYTEHTYPLDSTIDLHGILKLDSNNQLYADGDVYKADGTVTHNWTLADLGSLNWIQPTSGKYYATLPVPYSYNGNIIMLCSGYAFDGVGSSSLGYYGADKTIRYYFASGTLAYEIYVHDEAYSDLASFKTAMNGVYLLYPLATPTTEQAEPYNPNQICDPNGTEEYISDTVAPVGHVTKYPLDIAGRLDNILSMPSANGTYTLRAVVNNGKVTYSWVSA